VRTPAFGSADFRLIAAVPLDELKVIVSAAARTRPSIEALPIP